MNTGMEYEDILMRNQELMATIDRLTAERDEFENNAIGESTAREMALNVMYNDARTVIERLTAERDEARRMYCQQIANESIDTEQQIAEHKGWDCYKEKPK